MARRSQPARKRRSSVRADDVPVDASAPGKRRKVSHESDDGEVAMSETPKLNLEDQFKAIAAEAASQSNATDTGSVCPQEQASDSYTIHQQRYSRNSRDSAINGLAPAFETQLTPNTSLNTYCHLLQRSVLSSKLKRTLSFCLRFIFNPKSKHSSQSLSLSLKHRRAKNVKYSRSQMTTTNL